MVIIRVILGLAPLLIGALFMIGGGACVFFGAASIPSAGAPGVMALLIGSGSLVLGFFISRFAYRWITKTPAPVQPPHDS
jgi:hypothetical protein